MPKQFSLDCMVDLPDDPFAAAELVAKLKVPWYAMLKNLQDAEVKFQHKQEMIETRAKPTPKPNGERRTRRTAEQIAADKAAALNGGAPERESVG